MDFDRFAVAGSDRFGGDRLWIEVDSRLELGDRGARVAREVIACERQPCLRVGGLQAYRPLERRARTCRLPGDALGAGEREQRFHRQRVTRYRAVGVGDRATGVACFQTRVGFLAGFF